MLSVHGVVLGIMRYTKLENQHLPGLQKSSKFVADYDSSGQPTTRHGSYIRESWSFKDDAKDFLGTDARSGSPMVFEDEGARLLAMILSKRNPARLDKMNLEKNSAKFKKRLGNDSLDGIYSYMVGLTRCRNAVETDTVELALTPSWSQPGDVLCQLIGCTAATVLRKLDSGNYKFIGECYVLGKMGQAMIDILKEAVERPDGLQRFDLV